MTDHQQPPGYYVDAFGHRGPRPTFYTHPLEFQRGVGTPPLQQQFQQPQQQLQQAPCVSPPFGSPPLQGRGVTRPYSLFASSEPAVLPQEKAFQAGSPYSPVSPVSVFGFAEYRMNAAPAPPLTHPAVAPPSPARDDRTKKVRPKLHLLPRSKSEPQPTKVVASSRSSNIFGGARPREEVLRDRSQKGEKPAHSGASGGDSWHRVTGQHHHHKHHHGHQHRHRQQQKQKQQKQPRQCTSRSKLRAHQQPCGLRPQYKVPCTALSGDQEPEQVTIVHNPFDKLAGLPSTGDVAKLGEE
mmetsp:Transcript_1284/g.3617  ORF Transcript_1284/g.3617 Transcript_1284/m.3617 type:complete len:297 (+) Transcript_1284:234-1124(+)